MAKTVFRSFSWQKVTTQNVVRILISSYFIAFAIGVFPGTDVSVLLDQFLPAWISTFLTHLGVFTLAVMILTGVQRRAAALLLAIMVFWASYMILMSGPTVDVLGNFWRDLALIGALIMTYADADSGYVGPGPAFIRSISRRGGTIGDDDRPTSRTMSMIRRMSRPSPQIDPKTAAEQERYREDLSAARAS